MAAEALFETRDGHVYAGEALRYLRERDAQRAEEEQRAQRALSAGEERPAVPVRYLEPGALVGAAEEIDVSDEGQLKRLKRIHQQWQELAWAYYDALGPIKFSMRFIVNSLVRIQLYGGVRDPDDPDADPIPADHAAKKGPTPAEGEAREPLITEAMARQLAEEVERLVVTDGGQGQFLADIGLGLSIAGESYVFVTTDPETQEEEITVRSDAEIFFKPTQIQGNTGIGLWVRDFPEDRDGQEVDPKTTDVVRIWRRHGRYRAWADSNMRAILDDCAELLLMKRMFMSMGKSRLNAGIFLLAQEASYGPAKVLDAGGNETTQLAPDPFDVALMAAVTAVVSDDASPANVAPVVARISANGVDHSKWVDIGRKISDADLKRAAQLVDNIAQGIDLPAEVLTGMAQANHWSAWLIDDSTYRAHIEPLVQLERDQLVSALLRPRLLARSDSAWTKETIKLATIGVDPSRLVADPDRGKAADEAWDRYAISWESYRTAKGFSEADAPTNDELIQRAAIKGAERTHIPAGAPATEGEPIQTAEPPKTPAPVEPTPADPAPASALIASAARRRNTGDRLAAIDRGLFDRLLDRSDAAMERALERAGARLRSAAQANATSRPLIAGAAALDVGARLGAERGRALVADADLLADAFTPLGARFDQQVARAQEQARAVLADRGLSEEDERELEAEQETHRTAAWAWLAGALVALARERIYDPHPAAPALGEHNTNLSVPAGLIRNALARAGGATPVESPVGGLETLGGGPAGLVATGDTIRQAFAQSVGAAWTGYRWDYGDSSGRSRPFSPHEDLDGVEFASWQSDELLNGAGEWPGNDYWRPGDHFGCQCSFTPLVPDTVSGDDEPPDDGGEEG